VTRSFPLLRLAVLGLVLSVTVQLACSESGGTGPNPVPTTLTLNKATVALDALGATDALSATVRDQNGNIMSGASVSWTSSSAAVASVSASGVVTAVANGSATVTASSGAANGQASVTVAQRAAQLQKLSGDAQTAPVVTVLADSLVLIVNDSRGNAIAGVSVAFAASASGGSVSPGSAATGAGGRVAAQWTFGTAAGAHTVTATPAGGTTTAQFGATATAAAADSVFAASGNAQTGTVGAALPAPLVVKVIDQYANGVAGADVVFTPAAGSGSVNPTNVQTGANGEASTTWTIGATLGSQSVEASAAGLKGDPVTFTATGSNLSVAAVSPDTMVEGASATLTGTGFSTTPANNTVTIGGLQATVTSATATTLGITVPTFACQPVRTVNVQVTVGGTNSNTVSHPVRPASLLALAPGEMMLVQDPTSFCLQFAPSSTGGNEYLVGVGAAAESPTLTLSYTMTAVQGAAAPAPVAMVPAFSPRSVRSAPSAVNLQEIERRVAHDRAEQRIRAFERQFLDPATNAALRPAAARSPAATMAVPNVGDTLHLHVPNIDNTGGTGNTTGACDSIGIDAVVKTVGSAGIFVTDLNNPAADSLTDAEIQAHSDTFDLHIYAADTTYFGTPSDLDINQRVFVVLTIEVNKLLSGQIAGFVFAGDLFSAASCASSDEGELFYGHVPDPGNVAGMGARQKSNVLFQMPSLIAHEFTHNIQQSRRIVVLGRSRSLSTWEAEGQATLAEEVVGHSILGNTPGMDYGASVALSGPGASWYRFIFDRLAWYFGWAGGGVRNANAPDECTLFGTQALNSGTPCEPFWFYGASWAFQRYVADRFGQSYPGGETALTKDWIAKSDLSGVQNVEALLGVQFDSVFARWAAQNYVDGRPGVASDTSIQMASWNVHDVLSSRSAAAPLAPAQQTFGNFAITEQVRPGSTVYTLLAAAASRPALAIRVRDLVDAPLGTATRPQIWIVRTK